MRVRPRAAAAKVAGPEPNPVQDLPPQGRAVAGARATVRIRARALPMPVLPAAGVTLAAIGAAGARGSSAGSGTRGCHVGCRAEFGTGSRYGASGPSAVFARASAQPTAPLFYLSRGRCSLDASSARYVRSSRTIFDRPPTTGQWLHDISLSVRPSALALRCAGGVNVQRPFYCYRRRALPLSVIPMLRATVSLCVPQLPFRYKIAYCCGESPREQNAPHVRGACSRARSARCDSA